MAQILVIGLSKGRVARDRASGPGTNAQKSQVEAMGMY